MMLIFQNNIKTKIFIIIHQTKIDNYLDLIKPLYQEFDKSYIAQLCARIAKRMYHLKKFIYQKSQENN